jgi:hypothetical protein
MYGKFPRNQSVSYAGNKLRSYKLVNIQMFMTSEKVKPGIENIRDLSLAVVKYVAVQVTRQPL